MEDLAAFAEKADRDWQERADGLEVEHQQLMAWLVEQSESDPLLVNSNYLRLLNAVVPLTLPAIAATSVLRSWVVAASLNL
ncbi:hypothetical protein [Synechococcus sp. MIT S9507]|uniref:hypothetical protein n=1 Tax=Synechococcus sp. MIT S9507 TaxID=3082544 RepID=UPI0039B68968